MRYRSQFLAWLLAWEGAGGAIASARRCGREAEACCHRGILRRVRIGSKRIGREPSSPGTTDPRLPQRCHATGTGRFFATTDRALVARGNRHRNRCLRDTGCVCVPVPYADAHTAGPVPVSAVFAPGSKNRIVSKKRKDNIPPAAKYQ
ncbi:unnamed protein product [Pseudo-nitzschia multistriata]|uniref:Secreted protein n=1 Tax=Pseudo-nitzschia multistriata TaxID=183589 RepID=A0A448ZDB5_9STRA|nr:unnamed protein product [Pseudo-nitzschia multistriata]